MIYIDCLKFRCTLKTIVVELIAVPAPLATFISFSFSHMRRTVLRTFILVVHALVRVVPTTFGDCVPAQTSVSQWTCCDDVQISSAASPFL